MKQRALDICPNGKFYAKECFFDENTENDFDFSDFTYVADCIDSVKAKARLIELARRAGIPVISSMGAGNKLDGNAFRVAEIEKTRECPLARIMRRELKARGVTGVKAVYSEEKPLSPDKSAAANGERFIGSISYVPSMAGLLLAGTIIQDILKM